MTKKIRDNYGRFRSKTVAFRVSPEEWDEIDDRVKMHGYEKKQDYLLDSLLCREVKAIGNPLMLISLRKELNGIRDILTDSKEGHTIDGIILDNMLVNIETMLRIFESFAERGDKFE